MEKLVYSIKDTKVGIFNPPFYMEHEGQAIRTITSVVNDKNTQIHMYPEDFELWYLGEFNDSTAEFNQGEKKMVCTANSCRRRDVQTTPPLSTVDIYNTLEPHNKMPTGKQPQNHD